MPPRKDEILRSTEYYETILPALGVNIHLNTEATKEIMNAADAVIVAVGAHDLKLPIPGADGDNVVSSWDVLAGKCDVKGHCAVIGGGLVGTETAEYLLEKGCTVSIIEMMDKIATAMPVGGLLLALPEGGYLMIYRNDADFQSDWQDDTDTDIIAGRTSYIVYYYNT